MTSRLCLLFYVVCVWCALAECSDGKGSNDIKRIRRSPAFVLRWYYTTTETPIILNTPDLSFVDFDLDQKINKNIQESNQKAKEAEENLKHFDWLFSPPKPEVNVSEQVDLYFTNRLRQISTKNKNYQVFHFYNMREDVMPLKNISTDDIIRCHSDFVCPPNTDTLCLKNNDIYCVIRLATPNVHDCETNARVHHEGTSVITENLKGNCMLTTISCTDRAACPSNGEMLTRLPCLTSTVVEIAKNTPHFRGVALISLSGRDDIITTTSVNDRTFCVPAFATIVPEDKKAKGIGPKVERVVLPKKTEVNIVPYGQSDLADCAKRIGIQACLYGPNYKLYPDRLIKFD